MGARRHDDVACLGVVLKTMLGQQRDKLVAVEIGKVIKRKHLILGELQHHAEADIFEIAEIVGNLEIVESLVDPLCLALDELNRPRLQFLGDAFVETLNGGQLLDRSLGNLFGEDKTLCNQQVGDHIIDVERLDEAGRAGPELFLTALGFLGLGQDVDVPAGQLRRQAHILAATADGKAQLVVRNDDFHPAGNLVHHHLGDFGRGQRVHNERGGILDIGNDLDLLALKFADNGLHAASAHADAGADRIDSGVIRQDGDLGAASGLAGNTLDLDNAVIDFGHFLGKELCHELVAGARQENLRTTLLFTDIDDIGTHPVALAQVLARDHLLTADHRLGTTKVDRDRIAFRTFHRTDNNLADTVLVFLVLTGTLGVAHLLRDHLLCGLGRDPAKFDRRQRLAPEFTKRERRLLFRAVGNAHLRGVVLDFLDHFDPALQRDRAGLAVDHRANVTVETVFRTAGFLDRLFHGDHHLFALDRFFARHHIGDLDQFQSWDRRCIHVSLPALSAG